MKILPNLGLTEDGRILFSTRLLRMFAYGLLSVILALYLSQLGLNQVNIGLLFTLTLLGDTIISLWITTHADRIGRQRMLVCGAVLMILAGLVFSVTKNFYLLLVAATVGVISPGGNEVGPFLSIEQASLTQLILDNKRTRTFAWYNLVGSFSAAVGALVGGGTAQLLQKLGYTPLLSYRVVVLGYALIGFLLIGLFSRLSKTIEVGSSISRSLGSVQPDKNPTQVRFLGLYQSQKVVFRLAALFSMDAFAGGFIIQSMIALWFNQKFGVEPAMLGMIFFGTDILTGISSLSAAWIASKIGLINTMVFTHLPSNILLILVPFMPNLSLAIALLLVRSCISQMDVPTRQSFTMAVVSPDERSSASGITGVARTIGASLSPMITGFFLSNPALLGLPFMISGGLKIIYDLTLYYNFRALKPPEEQLKSTNLGI